jgi:hypothetical protein
MCRVLDKCCHDGFADCRWNGILDSRLNYAGTKSMRDRQDIAEVEIMREHHETVGSCEIHYHWVVSFGIADA